MVNPGLRDEWCRSILFANMLFSLIPSIGVATFIVIALPEPIGFLAAIPLSLGIGVWFLTHIRLIDSIDGWVPYHSNSGVSE